MEEEYDKEQTMKRRWLRNRNKTARNERVGRVSKMKVERNKGKCRNKKEDVKKEKMNMN